MDSSDPLALLGPEARARVLIDAKLEQAGWSVQDRKGLNLFAARGVAVREKTMAAGVTEHECLPWPQR